MLLRPVRTMASSASSLTARWANAPAAYSRASSPPWTKTLRRAWIALGVWHIARALSVLRERNWRARAALVFSLALPCRS